MIENKSHMLASCNIEGDKHISTVKDFLITYSPDIVCFQEAPESETRELASKCGYEFTFRANAIVKRTFVPGISADKTFGLAILSRVRVVNKGQYTYAGSPDHIPLYKHGKPNSRRREIFFVDLSNQFRVATTHFTWAPEGSLTDEQRRDITTLLQKAKFMGECLFIGDFNFPRPNEIYQQMLNIFRDNIPSFYKSSLDPNIHPEGKKLQILIDYLFSTPSYQVKGVELIEGISDHKAIIARVIKR